MTPSWRKKRWPGSEGAGDRDGERVPSSASCQLVGNGATTDAIPAIEALRVSEVGEGSGRVRLFHGDRGRLQGNNSESEDVDRQAD